MHSLQATRILFIVNPGSGNNTTKWDEVIDLYFKGQHDVVVECFDLPENCDKEILKDKIENFNAERVVAVGGDGTVKLVAECLLKTDRQLGILPAGSANGMAKELGIPEKAEEALDIIVKGHTKEIHAVMVNGHLCVHLADAGFNAFLIKKFETLPQRGMWGYMKASLKVMFNNPMMDVEMIVESKHVKMRAAMIVIANATKYGSGAVINPLGKLDDEFFEVVVLKKISLSEIFKMTFLSTPLNPEKTEVFQTSALTLHSQKHIHFQVDGEYLGKVKQVKAGILPAALEILVPE